MFRKSYPSWWQYLKKLIACEKGGYFKAPVVNNRGKNMSLMFYFQPLTFIAKLSFCLWKVPATPLELLKPTVNIPEQCRELHFASMHMQFPAGLCSCDHTIAYYFVQNLNVCTVNEKVCIRICFHFVMHPESIVKLGYRFAGDPMINFALCRKS